MQLISLLALDDVDKLTLGNGIRDATIEERDAVLWKLMNTIRPSDHSLKDNAAILT